MNEFIPNADAVRQAAEQLLAPVAGGKPTLDDACFIAAENRAQERNPNTRIFWKAVYDYLDAKRSPKLAQAVVDMMEVSK